MYNNRAMVDYYLVILGNQLDPCAAWIGPMNSIKEAQELNEATGSRGRVTSVSNRFGPLSASRIIDPLEYKNQK